MYVKAPIPSEVYHLTKKANLESILDDGAIRRFDDTECWFCESLAKMKAYMEQTVLCEGKPYYGAGGQLCRYPKFEPDEHIILKLTPRRREGNWYRWNQEIPLNSPPELVQVAAEFSKLKIGFGGVAVPKRGGNRCLRISAWQHCLPKRADHIRALETAFGES